MFLPNQLELQALFSGFLFEAGLSSVSVKNYLSDLRNFLSFCASISDHDNPPTVQEIFQNLSKFLNQYLDEQKRNYTPQNTLNRRLASIRRFSVFMDSKFGLTPSNKESHISSKNTSTVIDSPKFSGENARPAIEKILDQFRHFLEKEKKTHSTVKNYVSDLNHFFEWSASSTPFMDQDFENLLSMSQLEAYVTYLRLSHTSTSVINRRQSSIKQFTRYCFLQKYIPSNPFEYKHEAPRLAPLSWFDRLTNPKNKAKKNSPQTRLAVWYQKYNSLPFTPYLHLAILALATSAMVIFGYNQIIKQALPSSAALPTVPRRQLSFQGRLTDSSGTPIVAPVTVVFKLWNHLTAGSQLYTSGDCSITPDGNGIFNTLIGNGTCGSEITNTVFTENRDVYLEVAIGVETLTPRQQIATVGYALNSETLQGYPASAAATINTVPIVDSSGNINIAVTNPSIISSSGTFTLKGQSLTLSTAVGSGGNIVIQPDTAGAGNVQILTSAATGDQLRIQNANLTTGNLISGYIGNNNYTGRLLSLTSGSSEADRFYVAASGQTLINANLANAALIVNQSNNTGNIFTASASGATKFTVAYNGDIAATGTLTGLTGVSSSGDIDLSSLSAGGMVKAAVTTGRLSIASGGTDYEYPLTFSNGLTRSTNAIKLGGTLTADTDIPLGGFDMTFSGTGNVGIGTTIPTAKLDVEGSASISGTLAFRGTTDPKIDILNGENFGIRLSPGGDVGLTQAFTLTDTGINSTNIGVTTPGTGNFTSIGATTPGTGVFTDLSSTGNTTFGNASGDTVTSNAGAWTFANATTVALNNAANSLNFDSNTLTIDALNNRVGIGTTTPLTALDIAGSASSSGTLSFTGSTDPKINILNGENFGIQTSVGGDAVFTERFTILNNGNVGIGLINPSYTLDINGSMHLSGALMDVNTQAGGAGQILSSTITGVDWIDPPTGGGGNNSPWDWDTGVISPFSITDAVNLGIGATTATASATVHLAGTLTDPNGSFVMTNFGIGDITPTALFTVGNGDLFQVNSSGAIATASGIGSSGNIDFVSLSAGGLVKADPVTGRLSIASSGTEFEYPLTFSNGLTRSVDAVKLGGALTANTDIPLAGFNFTFSGTGNVGIGTITPLAKLDIRGLDTSPVASISGATAWASLVVDNSGGGDLFTASTSGQTRFVIDKDGKVGIGLANPSSSLEVNGNVELTNLYDNDGIGSFFDGGCTGTETITGIDSTGAITCTSITGVPASAVSFADITIGTNSSAAMTVGAGASLTYSGGAATSGVINANQLLGATWAAPGAIGTTTPAAGNFTTIGITSQGSGAFTTLTSSGNSTFGTGASSINTIGSVTTPGTLTLHGATTLDNTFTVSGANLTSLGGNLTVTGTTWTATPTISGLITATLGLTANGALTANSTFTLGDGVDTGSVNTSGWGIGTTGDMTGIGAITMDGLLTGTLGATISGAVIDLNTNSNFATNINSGTSLGAVSIGGGSNTVAVNSTSWDISTLGVASGFTGISSSGNIVFSSLSGPGLVKADGTGLLSMALAGSDYENPLTFSNGLTRSVDAVKLGGALTANTDIPLAGFNFTFSGTGNVGIGTITPLAKLDIRGLDTSPVASISGATAWASLVVDNSGGGDLFTASTSGQTRFVIDKDGKVGIGLANPSTALEIAGATSTIANASGNITFNSASGIFDFSGDSLSNFLHATASGQIHLGNFSDAGLPTALGTGSIIYSTTQNSVLVWNGAAWSLLAGDTGTNYWQWNGGVLTPIDTNDSLTLGNTSTASAMIHLAGKTGNDSFIYAGDFGIGTRTPSEKLQVEGNIVPGTTNAYDLGSDDYTWDNLYLNTGIYYNNSANARIAFGAGFARLTGGDWNVSTGNLRIGDETAPAYTLDVVGDAYISSTLDTGGNVTINGGAGKLDVGTVDPPYTINGSKYATYMASMVGIKEETIGKVTTTTDGYVEGLGYRTLLDLDQQPVGSDVWLFSQTTDIQSHINDLSVLLTPEGQTKAWYEVDKPNKILAIYSSTPTSITYRLSAPRFDAYKWTNTRTSVSVGHVINDPNIYTNTGSIFDNPVISPELIAKEDGTYTLLTNGQENKEVSTFMSSIIANLQVGAAVVANLVTDNLTVKTKLVSPLADIDQINAINATISGTLYANDIKGQTIDTLHAQINLLDEKYSTASAILSDLQSRYGSYNSLLSGISTATVSGDPLALSPLATTSAVIPSDLALDSLNVHTLIANDLMANGSIFGNSFSSFNTDLFIQPTGDKPVHLLANLMTLYPDGKVLINGDVIITGTLFSQGLDTQVATVSGSLAVGSSTIASESANFNKLTTSGLIIASGSDPQSTISGQTNSNATIGIATIATGTAEISILNTKVTPTTLIYVTPTSNTEGRVLFVKSKTEGVGFTIATTGNVNNNSLPISFNYWLVETK